MLLHAGMIHLVSNVASILVIGIPLESRWGATRTLVVYVVSGIVASLVSVRR